MARNIQSGIFESAVQITDPDVEYRIPLNKREGIEAIDFKDISVFFHLFNFSKITQDVEIEELDKNYIKEIMFIIENIKSDSEFYPYFVSWFFEYFAKNDRKEISTRGDLDLPRYEVEKIDSILPDISNSLYKDFQSAPVLKRFKPKSDDIPNFALCVKCISNDDLDVARIIVPPLQRKDVAKRLRSVSSVEINDEFMEEFFLLVERKMKFNGAIEYGAIPFGEMGFWNLKISERGDLSGRDREAYRARRIFFAIISNQLRGCL